MKKLFIKSVLLLLSVSFSFFANSQGFGSKQIDSLISKSMGKMPQAGIAVVLVKDGEVLHSKGYGLCSMQTKEKVDENTLFAIASNSKAFTTAALSILVDEGKISWTDKVVDYIPEFKMYDPYVTANFTIQDLLTHRSGLGLGAGDLMIFPHGSDFTINDVVSSFQYQEQVSDFRTKYDYDNLLYIVAGEIIAKISGTSWTEFVETRIFAPLEMDRSAGTFQSVRSKTNIALPHSTETGELQQIETYSNNLTAAAGGIYSSVDDMSKWLLMLLNEGKYGYRLKKKLFSKKNLNEMWTAHTRINFNYKPQSRYKTHFSYYGLGWKLSDENSYLTISHTGGLPGMLSMTTLIPELNLGVVVLTNSAPGGLGYYIISKAITDSYIGVEKFDWIKRAENALSYSQNVGDSVVNKVWETVENANTDHLNLENFIGTYKDNWFGEVEVSLKEDKLWFRSLRSPKLSGEMFFYKATTFAIKMEYKDMTSDAFATFSLDKEGKATMIKMEGISPNIDFSFDYQDLELLRIAD
ncbi:MAG: serine hydrolase [Bacteroidetes bacterium]|jgi:CubicO group peptidase (beta-lactamase class C family)|nr:serine hydrolase [Bacteroidota bacterium]MBT6687411.1 serine hydrolase [Bacteroidota bacterium]MBT7142314.1 serine hydrolase [Bacteroidota bacterium]MBT7493038.1 serine hydrolase [Bacteroidota bacterium]